jgi:hypothetical protein
MEAMAVVRQTANAILAEQIKAETRASNVQAWRAQRAAAARR